MDPVVKNVGDAVLWAASFLSEKGVENPRLEAELLMTCAMGRDRAAVLASMRDALPDPVRQEYLGLVHRRGGRYPLQYLTGRQEFMSLPFLIEEEVLIPRGDTEALVEAILNLGRSFKNILDVGTGSGIIALSLAKYIKNSRVLAVDISPHALVLAAENARALGLADRVEFVRGDVFHWVPERQFDLVVSNPPYIPTGEIPLLQEEVRFEPPMALDGGADGLRFYSRLAELATGILLPGGVLAVEIGWNQAQAVQAIMAAEGFCKMEVIRDFGGRDRGVICRKGAVACDGAQGCRFV